VESVNRRGRESSKLKTESGNEEAKGKGEEVQGQWGMGNRQWAIGLGKSRKKWLVHSRSWRGYAVGDVPRGTGRFAMLRAIRFAPALWVMVGVCAQGYAAVQLGVWRAWLDSPGGQLPFGLELTEDGDGLGAVIVNGRERIELDDARVDGDEVVIAIPHYDGQIRCTPGDGGATLTGAWTRTARDGSTIEMPFHAEFGALHRFPGARGPEEGFGIDGRWRVTMAESGESIGVFGPGPVPGTIVGAMMSPTGDMGQLEGAMDGREVRLSTFDGSHAFLFVGTVGDDTSMTGTFYSGPKYSESWTAVRDASASVADGFEGVTWDSSVDVWGLTFPEGKGGSQTLEQIVGGKKGVVLEVMGTWCPNCHDAARMFEEILGEMGHPKGVEVVELAFEYTDDAARNAKQIAAYRERFGITGPIVVAGVAKKEAVTGALPGLSEMRAFPTSIFVRADGTVVAIHTGFAGPATGEEYAKQKARYAELVGEIAGK